MMNANSEESEMSLKEIIISLKSYIAYLWSKKILSVVFFLLGVGLGFFNSTLKPIVFPAELTFMINEDEGGGVGNIGSILGQIGLGDSRGSEYNLDKIVALSRSKRIVYDLLMDSIVLDGRNDMIANHYIDVYDLNQSWMDSGKEDLIGFKFKRPSSDSLSSIDKRVLKKVYNEIVEFQPDISGRIVDMGYDDKTGILSIVANTYDADFSILLANKSYEKISDFYIDKAIERQKTARDELNVVVDSIYNELKSVEYRLARVNDKSLGVIQRQNFLERDRLSREAQILTILYGESIKNKATSEFVLSNETPFFQVIDEPIGPIGAIKPSKVMYAAIGGLIGLVFFIVFFSGQKFLKEVMSS